MGWLNIHDSAEIEDCFARESRDMVSYFKTVPGCDSIVRNLFVTDSGDDTMTAAVFASFLTYAFVGGITPGPANLISLASAVKYGRKQALLQWRGLITGFFVWSMVAMVISWFMGTFLTEYIRWFTIVGVLYILWLAWHMLTIDATRTGEAKKNCNFMTGFLLQMTNVKIIILCLTAQATYALPYARSFWPLLVVGLIMPVIGPGCNLVWLFVGTKLQGFYRNHQKLLNVLMAASLVWCAVNAILSMF